MRNPALAEDESVWSGLNKNEQIKIKGAMQTRALARGQTLIEQGLPASTLYIVNFGLFQVSRTESPNIVAEIGPGQLVGEMGFFAQVPRTASVIAAEDSEVFEIARGAFEELAGRYPDLQRAVSRAMANRLVRLTGMISASKTASPANLAAATEESDGEAAAPAESLTPREIECLRWVSVGKTYWEIGVILSISAATVKFHVDHARHKLGVFTRTQAIVRLIANGLL